MKIEKFEALCQENKNMSMEDINALPDKVFWYKINLVCLPIACKLFSVEGEDAIVIILKPKGGYDMRIVPKDVLGDLTIVEKEELSSV